MDDRAKLSGVANNTSPFQGSRAGGHVPQKKVDLQNKIGMQGAVLENASIKISQSNPRAC